MFCILDMVVAHALWCCSEWYLVCAAGLLFGVQVCRGPSVPRDAAWHRLAQPRLRTPRLPEGSAGPAQGAQVLAVLLTVKPSWL